MKIIWKIIIISIAAGLILSVLGLSLGASRELYVDRAGVHVTGSEISHITEPDIGSFKSIYVNAGLSDVEFISSDKFGIELFGNNMEWNWTLENDLLSITHTASSRFMIMNLNIIQTERNFAKIFLPDNTMLEDVAIKTGSGDTKLGNFQANRLEVTSSFGDVNLYNITGNIMQIDSSSGKLTASNLDTQSLIYRSGFGDGRFQTVNAANFTANSSSGDLHLIGCEFGEISIKTGFGGLRANNLISSGANIQTQSGDVNISGEFSGETTINTGFGDIRFTTSGEKDDYSFDISTRFGDITLDGERQRNQSTIISNPRQPIQENHINITSSSGDIRVSFEK